MLVNYGSSTIIRALRNKPAVLHIAEGVAVSNGHIVLVAQWFPKKTSVAQLFTKAGVLKAFPKSRIPDNQDLAIVLSSFPKQTTVEFRRSKIAFETGAGHAVAFISSKGDVRFIHELYAEMLPNAVFGTADTRGPLYDSPTLVEAAVIALPVIVNPTYSDVVAGDLATIADHLRAEE